ncbi:hypothetical protein Q3G72_012835 [Acer saccharum]|nr:hypothetical protein Q3G72_012835 [Acer saccharum]
MLGFRFQEHGIGLLDVDGRLAQTSFTFVDDEGSRKKVEEDVLRLYPQLAGLDTLLQEYPNLDQMEEYADRKQQLGKDLTQLRNAVRASYATGYLTDVFYRAVSKDLEYPNLDQMEEYADRKQQLGKDLTQLRNAVRASYATGYLTDVFYRAVSKGKLQRNKRHRRKEKMVQFAGRIGYQTYVFYVFVGYPSQSLWVVGYPSHSLLDARLVSMDLID